jgi:hypothetical protein
VGGMTPLHHTVYDKWSFKRIITMGDSAHKVKKQFLVILVQQPANIKQPSLILEPEWVLI